MWHSREVLSVDGPVIVSRDGERRSDEAVPLTFHDQRTYRVGVRRGLDGHLEVEANLDHRPAPVLLAPGDDGVGYAARNRLVTRPSRVVAEAREDAPAEPREDEMLGRPLLLL